MTTKLTALIVSLSEDAQLRLAYTKDPDAVMNDRGLSESEKAALRSGDEAAVYRAIGAAPGFTFAKLIWSRPKLNADSALKRAA